MKRLLRQWALPALLALLACAHLVREAAPRLNDGSEDPRHAHHAMHDESRIIESVWEMLGRGDWNPRIAVYPGLYPYTVAAVMLAVGESSPGPRTIEATRAVSLVTMVLALLASFVLFGLLADNPWVGALFALFLGLHPETVTWASRVHPDAHLILFTHVSLALLGLYARHDRPALLWLATAFAGLSAGTKLVGCFVTPIIAGWLVWRMRADRRRLAKALAGQALLFLAVFVLTTPRLLSHTRGTFSGYLYQHDGNVAGGGSLADWYAMFVGPQGLGWSGSAVAAAGVAWVAARRRIDAALLVAGFALFYLAFLLSTVRLIMPRYAFPTMWPALFLGLWALTPRTLGERPRAAALGVLVVLFGIVDLPRQRAALAEYRTFYARSFTPDKAALGELLLSIPDVKRKAVISSPYAYVPYGIEWRYIWSSADLPVAPSPDVAAIIVDGVLRGDSPGLRSLMSGQAGFVKSATAGEYELYLPLAASAAGAR